MRTRLLDMEMIVLGASPPPELAAALESEGFALTQHDLPAEADGAASATLVMALREAEAALADSRPAAVLVTGDGDAALAAALVAVKLEIPTAWLAPGEEAEEHKLIGLVADLALSATADTAATARGVRQLVA